MKPADYVEAVKKTESSDFVAIRARIGSTLMLRLLHVGLGVATEMGELIDTVKKYVFYGKPYDLVNIKEELGDLLWYIAVACDTFHISFEELMEINAAKLKKRYGDRFTEERAINRDLIAERKILEREDTIIDECVAYGVRNRGCQGDCGKDRGDTK